MKSKNYQIFRAAAVQHYVKQQQKAVLPRFLCPRIFVYLWILLALLLVASAIVIRLVYGSLFAAEARTGWIMLAHAQPIVSPALLHFEAEKGNS